MIEEKHPFGSFVPKDARYLFLGSFAGKTSDGYDWFFGTKRNQFWPIMAEVYGRPLQTKDEKQKLFANLKLAITDIILSCERKDHNNSDGNLINAVINTKVITNILKNNPIKTIFFSSRFAEHLYKRHFMNLIRKYPQIDLVTLPSPSPRYAAMSLAVKVAKYTELLPKLISGIIS